MSEHPEGPTLEDMVLNTLDASQPDHSWQQDKLTPRKENDPLPPYEWMSIYGSVTSTAKSAQALELSAQRLNLQMKVYAQAFACLEEWNSNFDVAGQEGDWLDWQDQRKAVMQKAQLLGMTDGD
jgi:hypothetical protein